MTLDEAIKHAEEVANANERLCETVRPAMQLSDYAKCAEEHAQLAEWLTELKGLRAEHESRANKESAQYVFDELLKCSIFRGIYDAKNGNEHFMYGVCTVMKNIAYMISEECHDRFDAEFMQNMQISEDKHTSEKENADVKNAPPVTPQPCGDAISRQAVLDVINFEDKWLFDAKSHNENTKIAFSSIKSKISKMSPSRPEKETGRWIPMGYDGYADGNIMHRTSS